jgi:alkylation response protein AidB-like acyl-CoA dehydrogenase
MPALAWRPDLEDIAFCLFDQLDIDVQLTQVPKWAELDEATMRGLVDEAARIAADVLAPLNATGDRQGCRLDADGNVTTPDGFKEAWRTVAEGGWISVSADPEVGGAGLPPSIYTACIELFIGASMAFEMYPGLTAAAARVIAAHAPEHLRVPVATQLVSGAWSGTMCLTEAGAGSDVGENRCKAAPQADGTWLLEGEKIFISGGDSDVAPNVVHLVLARSPGSPPGVKGLSLFLVPKFDFDESTLALGARNGAKVVGIEEKMGIHGSATCTLSLGADRPCKGWLVGEEHRGIEIMFLMMNEARIGVGAQGVAIAAAAWHYARLYAAERSQGPAFQRFKDPTAPRVPIAEHPDVRRMLMTLKVHAELMRSMMYRLVHRFERAEAGLGTEEDLQQVELLVPVLKAFCTDKGFDMAVMAVQVFGGYGYIGEYPVEQLVRDAKICSIYEGTNGIQAMDLLGRKMRQRGGAVFQGWMTEAQQTCMAAAFDGFGEEADAVTKAVNALGQTAMHLGMLGMQDRLGTALLQATPFLQMFGTVQLALEALDQAVAARRVIAERGPTKHLEGKARNLRWYVRNALPFAVAYAKVIQASDETALEEGAL